MHSPLKACQITSPRTIQGSGRLIATEYGPIPEREEGIRKARVTTHPFEAPTASAIRALWNGEIDSAAAATATAVAGVINCGVLEVERRVLGLDAEVEKEDTVSSIHLFLYDIRTEGKGVVE